MHWMFTIHLGRFVKHIAGKAKYLSTDKALYATDNLRVSCEATQHRVVFQTKEFVHAMQRCLRFNDAFDDHDVAHDLHSATAGRDTINDIEKTLIEPVKGLDVDQSR